MRLTFRLATSAALFAASCQKPPTTATTANAPLGPPDPVVSTPAASAQAAAASTPIIQDQAPAAPKGPREPNGNGAADDPGHAALPLNGHWERLGRHWGSLTRICDLQPFGEALYAAHATKPLGWDGASITRYAPNDTPAFTLAFDWNRPGEPSTGGGGGQSFLRIRSFHGRMFTPDVDPPYLGLGMRSGIEGYVFVSDSSGNFAAARRPHHRPPLNATSDNAGVALVPDAYHLFDVIEYQGRVYASAGVRGPGGTLPGALMVSKDGLDFAVGPLFPEDPANAAFRLTFMVRFQDALFVGVEVLGGRGPDYLRFQKQPTEEVLTKEHAAPMFVTPAGGRSTLRWFTHQQQLYWISAGPDGVVLAVSDNGSGWQVPTLPDGAGAPLDLALFGNTLVLLTEHQLLALDAEGQTTLLGSIEGPSPFALSDHYCAAPLAVFHGELYAGGQRRGELYKFIVDASSQEAVSTNTGAAARPSATSGGTATPSAK